MKKTTPWRNLNHLIIAIGCSIVVLSGCSHVGDASAAQSMKQNQAVEGMPSKSELKTLLPESVGKGQPAILDFSSQFCLACQQIKPKLEKIAAENPKISLYSFDLQHLNGQSKALFKAFHVVSAPDVVFISGSGHVTNVFYEDTPMPKLQKAAESLRK